MATEDEMQILGTLVASKRYLWTTQSENLQKHASGLSHCLQIVNTQFSEVVKSSVSQEVNPFQRAVRFIIELQEQKGGRGRPTKTSGTAQEKELSKKNQEKYALQKQQYQEALKKAAAALSTENELPVLSSKSLYATAQGRKVDFVVNVGAAVTCMAVSVCESSLHSTVVAVATTQKPEQDKRPLLPQKDATSVQFWSLDSEYLFKKDVDGVDPSVMNFVAEISTSWGCIYDMEWISCVQPKNSLGLLVMACGDGFIRVVNPPVPSIPGKTITVQPTLEWLQPGSVPTVLEVAVCETTRRHLVLCGFGDGHVVMWDISTSLFDQHTPPSKLFFHRLSSPVTGVCWRPMNVHIFATITLTGSLQVWDLRQPFTSIWSLTTGSYALRLCWPQQNLMGGCFEDGSLRIIAINDGSCNTSVLSVCSSQCWDMSFSPDGRSVAVSTASGLVMVYSRKKNVSDDVQRGFHSTPIHVYHLVDQGDCLVYYERQRDKTAPKKRMFPLSQSITAIHWINAKHNTSSFAWLLSGGLSGLVRLQQFMCFPLILSPDNRD